MKGVPSKVGDTMVNQNGYHHTRTEKGWRLTHHIVAEQMLGRDLVHGERVSFIDGNKKNLDPLNLEVTMVKQKSKATKRARLEARILELQAELDELNESS